MVCENLTVTSHQPATLGGHLQRKTRLTCPDCDWTFDLAIGASLYVVNREIRRHRRAVELAQAQAAA